MELNPEATNSLLLFIAAALGILVAFKVARVLLKGVYVVLITLGVMYFWQGGSVDDLKSKAVEALVHQGTLEEVFKSYCDRQTQLDIKCECLLTPIYDDLFERLTPEEIEEANQNKKLRRREVMLSLHIKKEEIKSCYVKRRSRQYERFLDKLFDMVDQ
ncbi:hypothetical protein [Pontibacter sp. G13]|uniref:hypothetical protein n=1 Tax=Pontibacter sp. G13 TaxID=3074898 RepID=UPI00288993A0|nr:hypothetical protein [Pontibacter sp. G13]WNJ18091.1 hypothetical protein RJD25_24815 [Pontibacter sp. G13]